jgi:hypothetical protein
LAAFAGGRSLTLLAITVDHILKDSGIADGKGDLFGDGFQQQALLVRKKSAFSLIEDFHDADFFLAGGQGDGNQVSSGKAIFAVQLFKEAGVGSHIVDHLRLLTLQNGARIAPAGGEGYGHEALLGGPLDAIELEIRLIFVKEQNRGFLRRYGFHDNIQDRLQEFMRVQALGDHGADRQVGIEVPGLSEKFPVRGVQPQARLPQTLQDKADEAPNYRPEPGENEGHGPHMPMKAVKEGLIDIQRGARSHGIVKFVRQHRQRVAD